MIWFLALLSSFMAAVFFLILLELSRIGDHLWGISWSIKASNAKNLEDKGE